MHFRNMQPRFCYLMQRLGKTEDFIREEIADFESQFKKFDHAEPSGLRRWPRRDDGPRTTDPLAETLREEIADFERQL